MKKRILLLILTALLPSLLLCSALFSHEKQEEAAEMTIYLEDHLYFDTLRFLPEGSNVLESVQGFHDWVDGIVYVFLPSYAQGRDIRISYSYASRLQIDGETFSQEATLSSPENGAQYLFTLLDESDEPLESYPVMFLYGQNLPALFLSTESGSLETIHADREFAEPGYLTVVEADGQESYSGVLQEVSGRGNTTWQQSKKPYSIKLDSAAGLLGMDKARNYELLANAYDGSHLRNEITFRLARNAGMEGTPDTSFADLYINGEYKGLYQLAEKVEIAPGRLDIEEQLPSDTQVTGSYLFMMEDYSRFEAAESRFLSANQQPFVLKSPGQASQNQIDYISGLVDRFETALLAPDGIHPQTGLSFTDYIDLDSFACKYLIEEISKNSDAVTNSQYFYTKAREETLYAGPVWDYDNAWGHTDEEAKDPRGLLLSTDRSFTPSGIKWYAALSEKTQFQSRVETLYQTVFSPMLQALTDTVIPRLQELLSASALMDWLRWDQEDMSFRYAVFDDYYSYVNYLSDFIRQRKAFLDSLWISHDTYYTVTFRRGEIFSNLRFTAAPGEASPEAPTPNWEGKILTGWYEEETGLPYEPGTPVTKDIVVTAHWEDTEGSEGTNGSEETEEPKDTAETGAVQEGLEDADVIINIEN